MYLSNKPRSIREHMVVDVGVLHGHGPVLVVSVKNQSESNREGHAEDMSRCDCGCCSLHQQPDRAHNTGARHFKLTGNACHVILRFFFFFFKSRFEYMSNPEISALVCRGTAVCEQNLPTNFK